MSDPTKEDMAFDIVGNMFGMNEEPAAETEEEETVDLSGDDTDPEVEEEVESDDPADEPVDKEPEDRASRILVKARKKEQEYAKREKELAEREELLNSLAEDKKLLDGNVLGFLEKHNISLEQLTDTILTDGKEDPVAALNKKVEELQTERQKERDAAEEKALKVQRAQLLDKMKSDLDTFVAENPEDYPLLIRTENTSLVMEHMAEVARETGEVLKFDEAAKQVEEGLVKWKNMLTGEGKQEAKGHSEDDPDDKRSESKRKKTRTLRNKVNTKGKPSQKMTNHERSKKAEALVEEIFWKAGA